MVFLIGERVILRPLEQEDIGGAYAIWINDQKSDIFTEHALFPHSRQNLEQYFQTKIHSKSTIWLAILEKESNSHIGNIELANIDWIHRKAEYSILIGDRSFQRQGYGFESSMLLLEHGFSKLNLNRIWLGVHEHNELAIKLYTRLGFVEEGCLRQSFLRKGVYSNLKIMGLLSEEFYNLHHQHET